ncbi:glycoside hydrolase family 2 protein [Streptomyces sp. DfronAA-171]|uniref:glycoside hydrolase family 2 protein n=1 Tax=Streptomyces sp. DfronAA-171 TaxID=1839777 RepID=UPI000AB0C5F5|nr:glycoside hydrolase family 2 protein [Streptomyces sp. DfronAA-171]
MSPAPGLRARLVTSAPARGRRRAPTACSSAAPVPRASTYRPRPRRAPSRAGSPPVCPSCTAAAHPQHLRRPGPLREHLLAPPHAGGDAGPRRLPDARLTVTALGRTRKGDREEVRVRVGNRGRAVAAMTRLSLREARGGDRVLPTLYSDNYLWLLPGESRTVTLFWPRTAAHAGLTVRAEPFNGSPVSAGA